MLSDSLYWKREIQKLRRRFIRASNKYRHYDDNFLLNFERDIFIAFYAVRKLIEARYLSDEVVATVIPVNSYQTNPEYIQDNSVNRMNNHKIDDIYELDRPQQQTLKLQDFCNQLIHSFVFIIFLESEDNDLEESAFRVKGLYVSSDRKRNKALYYVQISEIINLLKLVSTDNPRFISHSWDEDKKEYLTIVSNKSRSNLP